MNESKEILNSPSTPQVEEKELLKTKILVVDDEEAMLRISTMILENMGYTNVTTAMDGQELVSILTNAKPGEYGLVITDQRMPVMTGIEAIRKLRESGNEIPIILRSGTLSDVTDDLKKLSVIGMSKLSSSADLKSTIEKVLSQSVK